METVDVRTDIEDQRLPWHAPQVQQITVSLDTASGGESLSDGIGAFGLGSVEVRSDMRLKQGITTISDALTGVLALRGVTFRYGTAEHPELGLSAGPQIGFLAQELEQVYPQLVKTGADGFKAVNYAQMVPVLVEAIKEQQAQIQELQTRVKELGAK